MARQMRAITKLPDYSPGRSNYLADRQHNTEDIIPNAKKKKES